MKKRKRGIKKSGHHIFVGPAVVLTVLFVLLSIQHYEPNTQILGVTMGEPTPTIKSGTILLPTPTQIISAPTQATFPTSAPTSNPIIPTVFSPTTAPTAKPIVTNPTPIPIEPTLSQPSPQPTSVPDSLLLPQPTSAVIYPNKTTVPIAAYKTPISPAPSSGGTTISTIPQPTLSNAQLSGAEPMPEAPRRPSFRSLLSQQLVVTTIDSSSGQVERVPVTSVQSTITLRNSNEQFSMNLNDVQSNTEKSVSLNTFQTIADRLHENGIGIYVVGKNDMLLQDGAVGAITDLPLSVTAQNYLYVNTPEGKTKLDLLPSRALEFLDDINLLTTVKTSQTSVNNIKQLVKIVDYNDTIAYEVEGCKTEFFLAIFPVPGGICKTVTISAEDKDFKNRILSIHESPLYAALDILSL